MQTSSDRVQVVTLIALLMVGMCSTSMIGQTFTVVSNFTGASGAYPYGGLMQDSAGTIFGTTYYGGSSSNGTVFALLYGVQPVLHNFNGIDGSVPKGGLI